MESAGVVAFTVEFGGGTGWFKNGEDNVRDQRNAGSGT